MLVQSVIVLDFGDFFRFLLNLKKNLESNKSQHRGIINIL